MAGQGRIRTGVARLVAAWLGKSSWLNVFNEAFNYFCVVSRYVLARLSASRQGLFGHRKSRFFAVLF